MRTDVANRRINSLGWTYSYSPQARIVSKAAATTEPSETYRKMATTSTNIPTMHNIDLGAIATNEPKPVATPLPPRNFNQTGNKCPSTAKNAAMVNANL